MYENFQEEYLKITLSHKVTVVVWKHSIIVMWILSKVSYVKAVIFFPLAKLVPNRASKALRTNKHQQRKKDKV